jgi:hypothetical protein
MECRTLDLELSRRSALMKTGSNSIAAMMKTL